MYIRSISIVIPLLFLLPLVQAQGCLAPSQIIALQQLAAAANASQSDVLAIFTLLCDRDNQLQQNFTSLRAESAASYYTKEQALEKFYTKNDTMLLLESRIGSVQNISRELEEFNRTLITKVTETLLNLSGDIKAQVNLVQILDNVAKIANQSVEKQIDDTLSLKIATVNEKLEAAEQKAAEKYATKSELDGIKKNSTAAAVVQQPQADYTSWIIGFLLIAVVIAAYFKLRGYQAVKLRHPVAEMDSSMLATPHYRKRRLPESEPAEEAKAQIETERREAERKKRILKDRVQEFKRSKPLEE